MFYSKIEHLLETDPTVKEEYLYIGLKSLALAKVIEKRFPELMHDPDNGRDLDLNDIYQCFVSFHLMENAPKRDMLLDNYDIVVEAYNYYFAGVSFLMESQFTSKLKDPDFKGVVKRQIQRHLHGLA